MFITDSIYESSHCLPCLDEKASPYMRVAYLHFFYFCDDNFISSFNEMQMKELHASSFQVSDKFWVRWVEGGTVDIVVYISWYPGSRTCRKPLKVILRAFRFGRIRLDGDKLGAVPHCVKPPGKERERGGAWHSGFCLSIVEHQWKVTVCQPGSLGSGRL